MKHRVIALALALCLVLSLPVLALNRDDFKQGRLSGITTASDGALLVTDTYNKVVWRVSGDKTSIFAGVIGAADVTGEPAPVYRDGALDQAYFMEPWDIVPFMEGYAVSDAQANVIRYIADGRVRTLAGTGTAGKTDGAAKSASFDRPTGLAVDPDGALYVADTGNGTIRRITTDGKVATFASGLVSPTGICWYGGALYVAETGRSRVCRVTAGGSVEAFAGVSTSAEDADEYYGGYADAPVASAKFDHPQAVAAGADGTIYVADSANGAVRAIRGGRVYTLRGSAVSSSPRGLLVQGDTLLVADHFAGTLFDVSLARKTFSDVLPGMWYVSAVEAAVDRGIAGGTGDGLFEPDTPMNRAMFVTMLSRMHMLADGTVVINGDASFPDVAENEWYGAAVRWAADNDIVRGDETGFAPQRSISREELAVMLHRYAISQGLSSDSPANALDRFPDGESVSTWATAAMRWATANGILNGNGEGYLVPQASATRAQALTMLLNFMNAYGM